MVKKLIVSTFVCGFIALTSTIFPMEQKKFLIENEKLENKKKDQKKEHARILKQLKFDTQKKEFDTIFNTLKELENKFNKYEKNNTPYDELVKEFYGIFSKNQQLRKPIPFDPEKLLTVGLTYKTLPDFVVHAIMAYVGFNYTKLITTSSIISEHLKNGINTNQLFAIPWPKKKFQFLVPDNIEGKPIFSPDGSLLAVTGSKCITVFNTATGKKVGQCKKLFEGIQLIRFYAENTKSNAINILVKTEDGPTLYELNDSCNSSDGIPNMSLLLKLKDELKDVKQITKSNTCTTSCSSPNKKKRILKTPRNKVRENKTIYISLPKNLSVGSFLPPYTNRFGVVMRKINGLLAFMDLDLNKLFPPEKNDELNLEKSENILEVNETYTPFGLVSENGLYGLISTTKKTLDLYGFTGMLPPKEWFFIFCLRYGTYKKPLNPSGSWCSVYYSFNEKERNYLDKTYSLIKPKKKTLSGSIPVLDLKNILNNKSELDNHPNTGRDK